MTIHQIRITPELADVLIEELRSMDGNKWARAWLRTIDSVPEEARHEVLAGFVRELPHLYAQLELLGDRVLRTIAEESAGTDPVVPDTLGTLFAPLAKEEEE